VDAVASGGVWGSSGRRCQPVYEEAHALMYIITSYYLQTSNTLRSERAIITLPTFGCSSRRPRSRKYPYRLWWTKPALGV
jgi:hypothetical protein